ncbi:hypothetical protein RHOFW510R12_01285 [Rhodanobacter sp. FW510-R12]|uniref:RHS repeat-associated core domain-containing protein n=1 Tax=Rhodanobacter thiooxydans TaxID=416169 RepID=UPI00091FD211|nr:RHS repeat-associated core domain-containing protein [Rhodanobacter thiooxydans]UJJ56628.1 RHS repeat-associated core domain-containing protein [Rhodanobacter thiooxydans]
MTTGAYPRAYDAAGNTTGSVVGGETFGFAYNNRGRLGLAQRNGVTAGTYVYNVLGERVAKDAGSATTQFAYDEASQLASEATDGGFRDYVRLGDLPVAVVDTPAGAAPAEVRYIHADGLGSTRVVTDQTTAPVWRWAYARNPFGEQRPGGTFDFALQFPGHYADAETGLKYNVQRYYEATLGRYGRPDPLGLAAGPSVYGYVGSDPLALIDPLGLDYMDTLWATIYRATGGWSPPQHTVDFWAGLGDGASLGITRLIRKAAGTDEMVDRCSSAYSVGSWSSFALGAGRLAYAGLAKAGSRLASSGLQASAFRSGLRRAFGGGHSFRPPNLAKYGTDEALRAAAGRTNTIGNAWGAAASISGYYGATATSCDCTP